MKKIMGAVLAAAMLAGTVTADIGFSYKGTNYFGPSGFSYLGRTDCMSVSVTTEAGGVVVDFDTTDVDANTKGVRDVRYRTVDGVDDKSGVGLKQDEYYGWLNFGLPLGQLQITAGRWSGRNVNRVLTDRGDLEARDFELFKPGVINGTIGKDSANLTNGNMGMVAAWTLADVLPGTLMAKVGLANYWDEDWNQNGKNSRSKDWLWNPDKKNWSVKAGPLAEVSYWQEGAFRANLSVRSLNKHSYSFGAWISPELADTLQLTVGGTVATGKLWNFNGGSGWSDRRTEWGIDFRLRLQVTDDLSITTMNNISSGICTDGTLTNAEGKSLKGDSIGALWNMLNATYRIADNLVAALTLQSYADVFCPAVNDSGKWTVIMSPSLVIQATEKARVTTSVRAQMNETRNWTFTNMNVVVPVIFSFNY